ncbi:hypothetical protein AVEN_139229-1 [Araneus ventricosus]|uniref:Uncharacterized protein n=1 Tax=Araneus ventricosus TaxID=182803 RepID=A0A4Y2G096_ARAVE|nr:hypothetical protein AVEN_139229-1 [Araneus ventricosus]
MLRSMLNDFRIMQFTDNIPAYKHYVKSSQTFEIGLSLRHGKSSESFNRSNCHFCSPMPRWTRHQFFTCKFCRGGLDISFLPASSMSRWTRHYCLKLGFFIP